MKKNGSFWLGLALAGGIGLRAFAAPAPNASSEKKFYLFGGLDLGYAMYSASTLEVKRSGIPFGVRALAAYYQENWLVDGGIGFFFLSSSGTAASGASLKVQSRIAYLDLSPRYRVDHNWQIGPELQFWLATDNGLNATIFSASPNSALMGGLQGVYECPSDANKYRFGVRWLTDVNISVRNLNIFQMFFQIGFSPGGGSSGKSRYTEELKESDVEKVDKPKRDWSDLPSGTQEPTYEADPEPVVMSTPEPVSTPEPYAAGPREQMTMTLGMNELPFERGSARLPKFARDHLKEIGKFLGNHRDTWNTLLISSHTENQGKKLTNMKASKARADVVKKLLTEGGAPGSRIQTVGHGPNKPLGKGKNDRMEFEFSDVKDASTIQRAFGH